MSNSPAVEHEAAAAPALDINAETYPFDVVVDNLDKAAYFHFYSAPTPGEPASDEAPTGFRIDEDLHRFYTPIYSAAGEPIRAANLVGERLASFKGRWMLMPDWMQARPGLEPPPERLDVSRAQRCVMLDSVCRFGDGSHGFEGFGSGMTFRGPGGLLLAGAVGTILRGFGKFAGLDGTYTYVGTLCPKTGFRGSIVLRVIDPEDRFRSKRPLPPLQSAASSEPGVAYIVFRGQKQDRFTKTGFMTDSSGQVIGLLAAQQLRLMTIDAGSLGAADPFTSAELGPVIGEMRARIKFNITNPGAPGTPEAPIPFQSQNEFTFYDGKGGTLGTISSDGGEGRTFRLALAGAPRQAALRFGAFLPILGGTGCFEGIRGMMTDNSAVGIAPHAIVTFYALRIEDPTGKFRARFQEPWSQRGGGDGF